MKTLRLLFTFIVIAIFVCSNRINGQTVQVYTTATVTNGFGWCLNRYVSGFITYHVIYHVNKKTGYVDRMHANVHKAELYDDETGERYIYIDVANDNLGKDYWGGDTWEFWNGLDNGGFDYEPDNLNIPIGEKPESGTDVWATFRWIKKGGGMVSMHSVVRITVNANGDTTAEVRHLWEDCNP
jgi:hypothetical protein